MKPEHDPRLPDLTGAFDGLPPGHPMREKDILTLTQRFALPILLWFFDNQRNRGSGRSWLMAVVLLELAKRGQEVPLEDLSAFAVAEFPSRSRHQRYFIEVVERVMHDCYPDDLFDWSPRRDNTTIKYTGRRPSDLR